MHSFNNGTSHFFIEMASSEVLNAVFRKEECTIYCMVQPEFVIIKKRRVNENTFIRQFLP